MQRYFTKEKLGDYLILEESDIHHIKNVMRNKVGNKIECIYDKELYICEIEELTSTKVRIVEKASEKVSNMPEVCIAVALVKEQKTDLILQKLTELGISKIIPVAMERSIVKLDDKKFEKKKERWEKICKEAAEQSKRNDIPEITNIHTVKELQNIEYKNKFICSTRNPKNLVNNYLQDREACATMIFVIGPEGGISPKEEDLLIEFGYTPVTFGPQIMRVETAAIYIASVINFCSNR